MSGVIEFDKSITKVSKLNDANSQNYIIPGFVDLHCHGGGGFDTMQGKDAIKSMSEYHLKNGTTSLLATTWTSTFDKTLVSLKDFNTLVNEKSNLLGIDTEFIREKYYYPKLCLVQIGDSSGNGWAIDPLSKKINLDPLYNLLINEKILKVLHSPRQDFEIIFNILKKIPKPIFDTQSAAMTCGYGDSASYESLVNKIVNIKIDKIYSRWNISL